MYPQVSKLGAYLPKYIWAELWGPVPCVFQVSDSYNLIRLSLWHACGGPGLWTLQSIRAGAAQLVCQKSWCQGCSEQHGSCHLSPCMVPIPASSLGDGPLSQGCRNLWVVLKGSCIQLDIFPDIPLPQVHQGISSVAGTNFIFCLSLCSMQVVNQCCVILTECFQKGYDKNKSTTLLPWQRQCCRLSAEWLTSYTSLSCSAATAGWELPRRKTKVIASFPLKLRVRRLNQGIEQLAECNKVKMVYFSLSCTFLL